MTIRANLRDGAYEWLFALMLSWWVPLQLFGKFTVTYLVSLLLWVVPLVFLFPRFLRTTHRGSRRRQALRAAALYIFGAGVVLDFVFGAVILDFADCATGAYVWCPGALIGTIPIEEYLFYVLGGFAVVLVYVWADMHWLAKYNVRQRHGLIPLPGHLIEISPRVAFVLALAFVAGIAWSLHYIAIKEKAANEWWEVVPFYYTFLLVFAFLPLVVMYRGVVSFVNWRAFSFTGLYVFLTAVIWEVTLGLPGKWWFYQSSAMIGKSVPAWSRFKDYPIEALLVWIAVVFVGVFFYEFWETYYYDPRPPRVKLFTGSFPPPNGGPPPPPGISVIVRGSGSTSRRVRLLVPAAEKGELDYGDCLEPIPFEMVVVTVENDVSWRMAGAERANYQNLCFVDHGLTPAPRVFQVINEVLESPRIVGGSTSAIPEWPIVRRFLHAILEVPKAWVTARDRGVTFCRRQDFAELPVDARAGDQNEFLRGLDDLAKRTKRVLTRLPTDAVTEQRPPLDD